MYGMGGMAGAFMVVCLMSAVPVRAGAQQRGGTQPRADEGGLNPPRLPPAAPPAARGLPKAGGLGSWQRGPRVHESEPVQFRVGLKQSGLERLEATVLAVSDPSSQEYGRHLSLAQVQELVAPAREVQQTVKGWLRAAGVSPHQMHTSSNGDFVAGVVPAGTLERLLGVQLFRFHCGKAANATAIRTVRAPRLPTHVQEALDFVVPGTMLPAVGRWKQQRAPTPTKEDVSPQMLRSLYNISARGGKAAASQAVASFLHEYFSPSDLVAFQQQFSPESLGATPKVVGGNVAASPTLEASLDIQYIMSVAPSVTTQFWYTAGKQPHNPGAEPFIEFLAALSDTADEEVPKVFSMSYADDENQVDEPYARRVAVELQKAAARGITLVVASGDFGVAGNTNQICNGKPFIPTFPASSPYITAVGGTWYHDPEIAFQISGGGFSNYFQRPLYQQKAVQAFLESAATAGKLPPKHRYNATGRAFPDIAAQSANFPVKVKGADDAAYGTSAAAPVVAAVIALLNDERLAAGKSTLGLINPMLYAALDQGIDIFNDIIDGHNPGCGSPGFYAQKFWDPVTGVGTPNFGRLLHYVLSLP